MPTLTILLADSDPMQRQLVDMLLAQDGFHIVGAGSGRETLEYLKEHTPNLAILSVELPDVGGDDICRKLKAVRRLSQVPVILTTKPPGRGGVSHDLRQVARSVGADLLLQKPLGDKGLRDKVNALLRHHKGKAPAAQVPEATKNTIVLEEALQELGSTEGAASDDAAAGVDAVTEQLYRENEELRDEVAILKRRLARLESGLAVSQDDSDSPDSFVPGGEPSVPGPASPPEGNGEDVADNGDTADTSADVTADGAAESDEEAPAEAADGVVTPGDTALPDALPPDASREQLQLRVAELERRNRALIEALEEAEAQQEAPRGLFGRRRR